MSKMELAKKLAEMTQSMDEARAERNSKVKKIHHQRLGNAKNHS
jgi:hypothetical protein